MRRKTPLRTIIVDGRAFLWKADWRNLKGWRTVRLRVWGGDKTSQALHAHFVATFHGFRARVERGEIPPHSPVIDDIYIEPREVRSVIEYGLTHGWNPQAFGRPFCLTSADASPSPELALVDIQ